MADAERLGEREILDTAAHILMYGGHTFFNGKKFNECFTFKGKKCQISSQKIFACGNIGKVQDINLQLDCHEYELVVKTVVPGNENSENAGLAEYHMYSLMGGECPGVVPAKAFFLFDTSSSPPKAIPAVIMCRIEINLARFMQRGIGQDLRLAMLLQLLVTIRFFHSRRMFHGDLKPENILVRNNRIFMVCDFGASRCWVEVPLKDVVDTLCTPQYVLPGKGHSCPDARKIAVAAQIDLWSLLIILVEIMTGQRMSTCSCKQLASRLSLRKQTESVFYEAYPYAPPQEVVCQLKCLPDVLRTKHGCNLHSIELQFIQLVEHIMNPAFHPDNSPYIVTMDEIISGLKKVVPEILHPPQGGDDSDSSDLEKAVRAARLRCEHHISAINEQADARVAKADARVAKADAHVAEADARVAKADARVVKADAHIAAVEAEAKRRIKEADARVAEADARIADVKAKAELDIEEARRENARVLKTKQLEGSQLNAKVETMRANWEKLEDTADQALALLANGTEVCKSYECMLQLLWKEQQGDATPSPPVMRMLCSNGSFEFVFPTCDTNPPEPDAVLGHPTETYTPFWAVYVTLGYILQTRAPSDILSFIRDNLHLELDLSCSEHSDGVPWFIELLLQLNEKLLSEHREIFSPEYVEALKALLADPSNPPKRASDLTQIAKFVRALGGDLFIYGEPLNGLYGYQPCWQNVGMPACPNMTVEEKQQYEMLLKAFEEQGWHWWWYSTNGIRYTGYDALAQLVFQCFSEGYSGFNVTMYNIACLTQSSPQLVSQLFQDAVETLSLSDDCYGCDKASAEAPAEAPAGAPAEAPAGAPAEAPASERPAISDLFGLSSSDEDDKPDSKRQRVE